MTRAAGSSCRLATTSTSAPGSATEQSPVSRQTGAPASRSRAGALTSWQDREGARGKAQTILHLGPGRDDQRAGRRHLVEVGHHLDLIVAVLKDVGLRIHLVGDVGIHRLVPGRGDATLLVEEFDGLKGPGRKRAALE